ncbi:MAG: glutamyl-tRNA reductase [Candidatus Melainabacteria bacterium RIFCSPHIGHO2_02_FULL_34_12]|nr:MAG: glutamyl-tRNA reductase [Candidatus Melainabacteria bacterium RIFCSPHIGHO2_02_FULL_34_12]
MIQDLREEKLFNEQISKIIAKKELVHEQIKNLYLFTVNHKTAPVAIREKFSIPEYSLTEANQKLKNYKSLKSFFILSTCNRTEIYFKSENEEKGLNEICHFFISYLGLEKKIIEEYSTIITGCEMLEHAFKVASGLDSLVIGESQVLSQVKTAYSIAQKEHTLDNILELIFQNSIKCAKRIHKETNLSKNCQSISSAAIDLADNVAGPLKTKSIMVLGAGKMAELALEHIIKKGGSKETIVLNRSPHRVIEFSDKYKTDKSIPFESVYEAMNDVDIVIAATGAPHAIIFADQFNKVRKDPARELFIFDISMPRNIDAEFTKTKNVNLMDIDSLQHIYNKTVESSNEDLKNAEKIISENTNELYIELSKTSIQNLIKELKEKTEKIRSEKLLKLTSNKNSFTKDEVDYITQNIISTILHTPIKNLKAANKEEKIQILKDLFEI